MATPAHPLPHLLSGLSAPSSPIKPTGAQQSTGCVVGFLGPAAAQLVMDVSQSGRVVVSVLDRLTPTIEKRLLEQPPGLVAPLPLDADRARGLGGLPVDVKVGHLAHLAAGVVLQAHGQLCGRALAVGAKR